MISFYELRGWRKALTFMLLVGASLYLLAFILVALARLGYPFELEWLEGGSLEQVRRILTGQKIYVQPSLEFVPYIYTPLYFYLSAGLAKLIGLGFTPLRLVSLLATLGSFLLIYLIIYGETHNWTAGILGSALLAACFEISGAWFDLARVDALFLFLILGSIYFLRAKASFQTYFLASLFFSLSFLTKQSSLLIFFPLLIFAVWWERKQSLFFLWPAGLIMVLSTLGLNYWHQGWYNYYVFTLPRQHSLIKSVIYSFWSIDLRPVGLAMILGILYLLLQGLPKQSPLNLTSPLRGQDTQKKFWFYFLAAIGMIGSAWCSRFHSGAYNNVLMPAYAIIAILFGLAFHEIQAFIQGHFSGDKELAIIYVHLIYLLQFLLLVYNPLSQCPKDKDYQAGKIFLAQIAQIEGEVFIPHHPYLATLAGQGSYAHAMAIADVLRGDKGQAGHLLRQEILEAVQEQRFGALILDDKKTPLPNLDLTCEQIESFYQPGPDLLFSSDEVFRPVTGGKTRPEFLYLAASIGEKKPIYGLNELEIQKKHSCRRAGTKGDKNFAPFSQRGRAGVRAIFR